MKAYDVVVVGAGHNGLTCAAYLAMAGLTVKVVERRSVVGGAAVTEEFHPGFRNSVAAYTVSLLNPKVIRDLDLPRHGLRIVHRKAMNFLPTLGGDYLLAAEGRTLVMTSHDDEFVEEFASRVMVLADGCVVEAGDPHTVLRQPQHAATKALLQLGRDKKL